MSSFSKKVLVLALVIIASAVLGSVWSHSLGRSYEDHLHRQSVLMNLTYAGTALFFVAMASAVLYREDGVWGKRFTTLVGMVCIAVSTVGLGFGSYIPRVDWSIRPSGETQVLYLDWTVNYPAECRELEAPRRQYI